MPYAYAVGFAALTVLAVLNAMKIIQGHNESFTEGAAMSVKFVVQLLEDVATHAVGPVTVSRLVESRSS